MANYAPPDQQQQYTYNPQQQPVYNPNVQQPDYNPNAQQQWGGQQGNQQGNQQQYNNSTTELNQSQPMTGDMPPSYEQAKYGDMNPETGLPARFNPRPKYNDCWAFVLFIAQLIAFIVLSGFAFNKINDDLNSDGVNYYRPGQTTPYFNQGSDDFYWKQALVAVLIGVLIGLITAVLYFFLTQIEMLRAVTSISKSYPAMFGISFIGLFIQTAYSVYFMIVIFGCYEMWYDRENQKTPAKLKMNIVHVTIAGVYACYYFLMGSPQGMNKSPTMESFKRACTTSIGSICFGSLIVAAIQAIRATVEMLRSDEACLQGVIEYVNKYAYCQVAIFGKAYIPAAKDTWTILKDRGVVQIINDNLVGNVWAMAAILSGALSALGSYLYIWYDEPEFNYDDNLTYVIITIAFVMGFQMVFTAGAVIDSGCASTFVCLAEDPAALARTKPELFERIRATYPEVVQ
ncbi:putative choline transporter, neither null mutation nor overexpression affects choline transport [Entomortierella beljakovae]|nr:putative choline transporter, neither null mutation nor overexpression affects choline transport [Entomortierella beljakovae]